MKVASFEKVGSPIGTKPNLVYCYNVGNYVYSCSQKSCTKVKSHLKLFVFHSNEFVSVVG